MSKSKSLDAIVLFADLISSSRMSDVLNTHQYNKILVVFQHNGHEVLHDLSRKLSHFEEIIDTIDGAINGEEIRVVVVLKEAPKSINIESRTKMQLVTLAMFQAALDISLKWYLYASINHEKIKNIASPSRIGIGLHYGKVEMVNIHRGRWEHTLWIKEQNKASIPLGSSINFGKRVEAASRLSKGIAISISQSFHTLCVENGVPIVIGEKLQPEPKGFEYPQPIYDLRNQYAILATSLLPSKPNKIALLRDALYHDPNRVVIFYAMIIENFINRASFEDLPDYLKIKSYNYAMEYAQYPLGIVENPSYFHWLLAISSYRRSSLQKDPEKKRTDIDFSILHYKEAANQLSWATLDLAYAYLRRAKLIDTSAVNRKRDLRISYNLLSDLIEKDPLLFHAYNVRAILIAEINKNEYDEDNPSVEQASADLATAELLNPAPKYLYKGTRANVELAKSLLDRPNQNCEKVYTLIKQANDELNRAVENNKIYMSNGDKENPVEEPEEIPNYHFWRPGFTDPPYHPPRPSSLRKSWEQLHDEASKI